MLIKTSEVVFWVSSAEGVAPDRWSEWIRGHWQIENASHYVRDVAFAEDASRIRKNPDIIARLRSFAYTLIRASGEDNIQNARYRAALDLRAAIKMVSQKRELNIPGCLTAASAQIAAIALSHYRASLHGDVDELRSFEVRMIARDEAILKVIATAGNAYVAIAGYEAALEVSSGRIVIYQGARVMRDSGPRPAPSSS